MIGGGTPAQKSDPFAPIYGHMTDHLAGDLAISEIVVLLNLAIESGTFILRIDALYSYMIEHIPFVES